MFNARTLIACAILLLAATVHAAEPVNINTADAEALGIEPDMAVNVISRRGSVVATAVLSGTAQPGIARMVARGGEGSPIPLLDVLLDPVAKAPEEICAVRIKRV